jgi:hypothetical protein
MVMATENLRIPENAAVGRKPIPVQPAISTEELLGLAAKTPFFYS